MRTLLMLAALFTVAFTQSAMAGTWRDNFDDGDYDGWGAWRGTWAVVEGALIGESGQLAALVMGDESWSDYTVEIDVMVAGELDPPAQFPQAGLSVRNHFPARPGHYESIFISFGAWNIMVNHVTAAWGDNIKKSVAFDVEESSWHRFRAVADGTDFATYLDGELISEFVDDTGPLGKVALHVNGLEAHFDNVVIVGDDVPDGGSLRPVDSGGKLTAVWASLKSGA
ncbi:MAG: family 16 glycoside hydrolase [Candidatus Poribacteria bacterium]